MDLIEQANRHVVNLFNSPTLADCKQAVDFFVNLRHYRLVLPNIEQSLRLMFSLIWSVDKSICEAITQAFVKIYFDVAPTVPQAYVFLIYRETENRQKTKCSVLQRCPSRRRQFGFFEHRKNPSICTEFQCPQI
jgi:hypothetical protein